MGKLGFARIFRFKGIFRLCMCLVVVGIIILGAAERSAAASAMGSPPEIKAFSADPLILPDGGHAVYMFEVYNATKIQVIEAGEIINEYNGPPSTTSKGKATGRTTYQIRSGPGNTFDTTLIARNTGGEQKKTLTLSFATKSKPKTDSLIPPVSDNQTKTRTSKLGPQTPAPLTPSTLSSLAPWPRQFANCPDGCYACLKPDEAAGRGLTQKCLEQPCYYSPDKTQYWYCYGEPVSTGWCCKDGNVIPGTEAQCKEARGSYWSKDQGEAIKACQLPMGWCCVEGRVYQATRDKAAEAGIAWYATEAEATKACGQPMGGCCTARGATAATQSQCSQMAGKFFSSLSEAQRVCPPIGGCCRNGVVTPSTQAQCTQSLNAAGGVWYANEAEAIKACEQPVGGCCTARGATAATQSQCSQMGGKWTTTLAEAQRACDPVGGCCTARGATAATQTQCSQMGGKWTTTLAEAQRACEQPVGGCCTARGATAATQTQCSQMGGKYFSSLSEATRACAPPPTTYYCCDGKGGVYQSRTPGTGCYTTQAEATRACTIVRPPVTPITPITPPIRYPLK